MKVLITDKLDRSAVERVRAAGHDVDERPGLQGPDLAAALQGFHALMIRSATRVTGEVLRGSPTLKLVVRAGTGLDNVDVTTARRQGVAVFNTPASNAVSVAELTLGLMIAYERHLVPAASELRAGTWEKTRFAGRELWGRRLGLVGFGRIGRELANRARVLGMEIWAADPLLEQWPLPFEWVARHTLESVLGGCDFVSLHVPLNQDTRGMIGARELGLMRADAVLINCARGGIVDEEALLAALQRDALRGAILDVFATEPPGDHPLIKHPRVLATPHLGASTAEAQKRAGDEAATIVIEALGALQT